MSNKLPEALCQALLAYDSPTAILVDINNQAGVVVKAAAQDIRSFRGAPVRYQYKLALYEEGPVLCLFLEILDHQDSSFGIETFLDISKPEDLVLARKLGGQSDLALHFYDSTLAYHFTKTISHQRLRKELQTLIERAVEHLKTVAEPNWYAARAKYMRQVEW